MTRYRAVHKTGYDCTADFINEVIGAVDCCDSFMLSIGASFQRCMPYSDESELKLRKNVYGYLKRTSTSKEAPVLDKKYFYRRALQIIHISG